MPALIAFTSNKSSKLCYANGSKTRNRLDNTFTTGNNTFSYCHRNSASVYIAMLQTIYYWGLSLIQSALQNSSSFAAPVIMPRFRIQKSQVFR